MIETQINLNSFLLMAFTVLFSIVSYFSVRTLRQIDSNQTELFNRMVNIEKDMASLRAEHDLLICGMDRRRPKL